MHHQQTDWWLWLLLGAHRLHGNQTLLGAGGLVGGAPSSDLTVFVRDDNWHAGNDAPTSWNVVEVAVIKDLLIGSIEQFDLGLGGVAALG